ncbi:sporulation peptidase YabG [uncultured Clostridium sp.]|jgi:spore coat assembly protein|uniref:sporulation peptidase YabG n=1 Tax=uncultured Clostridium sp. TaxID=59620 RepID=UPI00260BFBD3|nr:sporulation peptidase YabG [uncultured Clostridium sp.]
MKIGDYVVRESYGKDIIFKVMDVKDNNDGSKSYVLKGISIRILADSREDDLIVVDDDFEADIDRMFNSRVNKAIKNVMDRRGGGCSFPSNKRESPSTRRDSRSESRGEGRGKSGKIIKQENLVFGRPGKILHIDGDENYLENCLKVYKQLQLEAVGRAISEKDQPSQILNIVKEVKPDIVVLTGHDGLFKNNKNYLDENSYRNSKYFMEAVKALREYNSSYDELVIFAGACQSFYEGILDSGANYASSPSRVLIHCLDPVFVCEKVAYTAMDKVVQITEVIENTITGIKGVGGLQTRGKYREGYPKSQYI